MKKKLEIDKFVKSRPPWVWVIIGMTALGGILWWIKGKAQATSSNGNGSNDNDVSDEDNSDETIPEEKVGWIIAARDKKVVGLIDNSDYYIGDLPDDMVKVKERYNYGIRINTVPVYSGIEEPLMEVSKVGVESVISRLDSKLVYKDVPGTEEYERRLWYKIKYTN